MQVALEASKLRTYRSTSLNPLGFGQPKDIGNLVSFLASPASTWITGSEHVIDGGWKS